MLTDPSPAAPPARLEIPGSYVTLQPLQPQAHADDLWHCLGGSEHAHLWDFMHQGPFLQRVDLDTALTEMARTKDRLFFAIVDHTTRRAAGLASYLNIVPANRTLEVGYLTFSPQLQRTRQATEAMYLMMRHAFDDLNYRRYEWKCNAQNAASRRAAERLGFTFEGIFRQHMIVKGSNRDTAWFAILDGEWPAIKAALEGWLSPENFDANGNQLHRLTIALAQTP